MEVFPAILRIALGLLAVLAAFGFIIFIHELGHFIAARRVGIKCPFFAIGFGPRLYAFRWRGTEFSVRLFPFGGYVQMIGEEPEAEGIETWHDLLHAHLAGVSLPATPSELMAYLESRRDELVAPGDDLAEAHYEDVREHLEFLAPKTYDSLEEVEGNFNDRTIPQRMMVIVGGVTMNFISALLLFWFVGAVWGLGDFGPDSTPRVSQALEGSPAAAAGLENGDVVLKVNGEDVISRDEMVDRIGDFPGQPITLTYQRWNEEPVTVELTPDLVFGGVTIAGPEPVVRSVGNPELPVKVGQPVTAVEGRPVQKVPQLAEALQQAVGEGGPDEEVEVTVEIGGQRVALKDKRAALEPVGRIGVALGTVSQIAIIERAIPELDSVAPEGPGAAAGLQKGDVILAVNGYGVAGYNDVEAALQKLAALPDRPVKLDVLRGEEVVHVTLPAGLPSVESLGVTLVPVTAGLIVKSSFTWIGRLIIMPIIVVDRWMRNLLPTQVLVETSAGPIGIMHMIYSLSDNGLPEFLFFLGVLNAAVGAFNLIPFPALDGSRLLILAIGALRGREVDPEKEARLHYAGLLVLLTVVVLVTFLDVQRILSGGTLIQ